MAYLNFESNYEKAPKINMKGCSNKDIYIGYDSIVSTLNDSIKKAKDCKVVTVECYPGVRYEEVIDGLVKKLDPAKIIVSDEVFVDAEVIKTTLDKFITDDRVFGYMAMHNFEDFLIKEKVLEFNEEISKTNGLVVIIGVGASIIHKGDILVYADLARWEIQQRYRSGELANWKDTNYDEEILRKYKRGYFIEWRMADRLKKSLFNSIDFLLDTNIKDTPKMITGKSFLDGLNQASQKPFRLVPYFDSGVWGGQWMKEVCHLDKDKENFAWSFDGVPEENSVYLQFGDEFIEIPSINIVLKEPLNLLGGKVHGRFGSEFPIRFDFLDTMNGGHLSLQVHPLISYIQEKFGMHYTQDESYYMLDAEEDAVVYLGLKTGTDKDEFINALKEAQEKGTTFDDEKFINKIPAKKHDHFLIPAGTIHCSGKNSMVLEISSTPYIFTFKLWDWDRLGMDGKPRPIHIEHGEQVIDFTRDTEWVMDNLVNRFDVLEKTDTYLAEKTGLHTYEPIEVNRYTSTESIELETMDSVNMLNLVDGQEAIVESLDNSFDSMIVHYAETFIIPACCSSYKVSSNGDWKGQEIKIVRACIKA